MVIDQLKKDQLTAMKSGDKMTLDVLRLIVSQVKYREIEKQSPLTDEEVYTLIRKQVKEIQESLDAAEKANRPEMIEDQKAKMAIARAYLPTELSDEELKIAVAEVETRCKDEIEQNPKARIGVFMRELKSKADPARIRAAIGM